MNFATEICRALELVSRHFQEKLDSVGFAEWTAELNQQMQACCKRCAALNGMGFSYGTGNALAGKSLCVFEQGNRIPGMDRGWLFDHCWVLYIDNESHKEHGYATRCVLAMESEWSEDDEEIYKDFFKLVVAKADIKLLVIQAHSEERTAEVLGMCETAIQCFERGNEGEETYIVSICQNQQNYRIHHFVKAGQQTRFAPYATESAHLP